MSGIDINTLILDAAHDAGVDFLYYDRKHDEDLIVGVIENYISSGSISVDDIVASFRRAIEEGII
jgi:hypothetical protein